MNGLSLIDSLLDGVYGAASCGERTFVPAVDIEKQSKSYVLYMDLPGKTEADIDLSVKENVLTIASANNSANDSENEKQVKSQEIQYMLRERNLTGNFKRTFTLANDCDAASITAVFKNGVLTVTIPIKKEAETQKIRIQAA